MLNPVGIARISGSFDSVGLLLLSLDALEEYATSKGLDEKYSTCMWRVISNYEEILEERGLDENKAWVDYCGVETESVVLNQKENYGDITIGFYCNNKNMGRAFWQAISDILDVTIEVRHYNEPKYNYRYERIEDFSEIAEMIGESIVEEGVNDPEIMYAVLQEANTIASVFGSMPSMLLLYKSLISLHDYVEEMNIPEYAAENLFNIIKNYREMLNHKGCYDITEVSCDFCGFNDFNVNEQSNMGTAKIYFDSIAPDCGLTFWQLMCDILDIRVLLESHQDGDFYNYSLGRVEDLSKMAHLIGEDVVSE